MENDYRVFFGNMNITEIKEIFLMNGFSQKDIKAIENGSYDPYQEY